MGGCATKTSTVARQANALLVTATTQLTQLCVLLQVDQAILSEEERVVVVRFGHDWDPTCMQMDEILYKIADKVNKK